jgi:hypothetical protein
MSPFVNVRGGGAPAGHRRDLPTAGDGGGPPLHRGGARTRKGTWLFPLGYLVYKSRFLPRLLGVLLMLDGIGVLIWFLQALLLPDYRAITYPGLRLIDGRGRGPF